MMKKKLKEAESIHQSKSTSGTCGEGNIIIADYRWNQVQQQNNICKDEEQGVLLAKVETKIMLAFKLQV